MTTIELLSLIRREGLTLRTDGQRLYRSNSAHVPERLASLLQERKTEIIEFFRAAKKNSDSALPPICPIARNGSYLPLSYAQERLWFLDQFQPGNEAYNVPGAVRIRGGLNVGALEQALSEIVRRHEVLRTTFEAREGQPVQVIHAAAPLKLEVLDLQAEVQSEQEQRVQELARVEAQEPFDLAKGPLLRVSLARLGEAEHVLFYTMHHIVADAWSMGVLVNEFVRLYEAFSKGEPSPLAELPIQYADYAVWQRQWLQEEELEQQLSYWKEQLKGAPELLELPTDRPRPAVQTHRGASQVVSISRDLTEKLKALSQREGVTLFMLLSAAFKVLLHRYSGQTDIVVGSAIANRNRAETEGLIGFFVNTLALRSDLSGDPSFLKLLMQERHVALGAYEHQDVPFEKVVAELQPERNLSHSPLFQVMLELQNTPAEVLKAGGLEFEAIGIESQTEKFDLTLMLDETKEGLSGVLTYSVDLFNGSTIERILSHWRRILEGMAAKPEARLSELELLDQEEKKRILEEWNATTSEYPKDKTVVDLFEEQVQRSARRVAVVFGKEELTYRQLDERANQLAHYLRVKGAINRGQLVGLCVERTQEMIVCLLGILKAGGAYLPLDPAFPRERLQFMIKDAGVSHVLTERTQAALLEGAPVSLLLIDEDKQSISLQPRSQPQQSSGPEDLIYCIYTSGSTGIPKGALIEHRNVVSLLVNKRLPFEFSDQDVWSLFHSYGFDFSVWEMYGALLYGGKVVVVARGTPQDPKEFLRLIVQERVTVLNQTPTAFYNLAREALESKAQWALRYVIFGGEALDPIQLREWRRAYPEVKLINMYGITETTVHVTYKEITQAEIGQNQSNIGRPLPTVSAYLMDQNRQLVPLGVTGEVYVGGAGVGRGYMNQEALTAERFVQNPHKPGERLYRSGDLAKQLPDGELVYLGRRDEQVKLRGYRIELGEIESVLRGQEGVKEAVVLLREDEPGQKRLVGYVVATEGSQLTSSGLREALGEGLPEYMVPSALVLLDKLPSTANGKVDRKALPMPEWRGSEDSYVAPRTVGEEKLVQIWKELLKIDQVGVQDNFFQLGGDSILSIQMVARANDAGVRITVRQLFEHQTIAKLGAVAGQSTGKQAEQGMVSGPVALTPIQHWFFEQTSEERHHFNQSLMLEVKAELEPAIVKAVVRKLVEHHDALRMRYEQGQGEWQQFNAESQESELFQQVDVSQIAESEQSQRITAEATAAQKSLDLTGGPLLRMVWFQRAPGQRALLLIVIHHLVVDGVSWRILLEDLQVGCEQLLGGQPVKFSPKTTSYQRWAQRLQEYGHGQEVGYWQEVRYWREVIKSPWAPLPRDKEGPENAVAFQRVVHKELSEEETRALLQEVPEKYHTQINDVLLTALARALGRWSQSESVRVDLEGHGREELDEQIDLTRTVGWFTSIYPVVLRGFGGELGQALKSVKEQLRRVPQHGIGYGVLRYLSHGINGTEALREQDQAGVLFNYLGQFDQVWEGSRFFGPAEQDTGPTSSERGQSSHLLSINSWVTQKRFAFNWTYCEQVHERSTIEAVAESFIENLRQLIVHCQSVEHGGHTPSDFPLARLSQQTLDRLSTKFSNKRSRVRQLTPGG